MSSEHPLTKPDPFVHRYGPWALVTGASSGIGEEFARQLAARGLHLVLCARRKDRLDTLAAALLAAHGTQTRILELDLSRPDFMPAVTAATDGLEIGLLVNNAGFGDKGAFVDADLPMLLRMLDTNCRAPLILAHAFAPKLVARGRGGIIFTSSTAAFQGLPWASHYAATKGHGLQLAEGLFHELKPKGVDVLALCPGPTDTEGPRRTGVDPDKVPVKMMQVGPVVAAALAALGRAPVAVPGASNRLVHFLVKLVGRRTASALGGRMIRRVTGG
ncbi:MAG TPA: SDR family NAD(P)-dependent oxidoreductase [Kofleriaceae bacterium]|nr:SDR family NAD(P)-dependent oxidoreductase [Kofleriaceae bacterium]